MLIVAGIVAALIIAWVFYYFFIEGNIFPIILLGTSIVGSRYLLINNFEKSKDICLIFMQYSFSFATCIAVVLSVFSVGVLVEKLDD